jgi:alkanesulfonate monooxygenase SsuD/methylene tetrahydromethanopterin reductase-like flavin-dependent oxidoreductase (luciferase family)
VGGNGEQRTLDIAARLGDACNLPSDVEALTHKLAVLDRHLAAAGRTRDDVAVTVLDLPVVGRDREDAWARVERLRGRTAAAGFARRTHAGTVDQHRARYVELQALGVSTVFVGVRGLDSPDEVAALAGLNA